MRTPRGSLASRRYHMIFNQFNNPGVIKISLKNSDTHILHIKSLVSRLDQK
ncbi:hypothetical protein ACPOL_2993 [Acidisarcina polymorpha]|uniref:Uncharacterized protein n=1 Tax=Acidisarcina polymorpha TaxID=2211140 RepID=A0A2Z5G107_9BACT|nr:hypothetical protein ACPOL_2993 [Acidisarcina polymorpha]